MIHFDKICTITYHIITVFDFSLIETINLQTTPQKTGRKFYFTLIFVFASGITLLIDPVQNLLNSQVTCDRHSKLDSLGSEIFISQY